MLAPLVIEIYVDVDVDADDEREPLVGLLPLPYALISIEALTLTKTDYKMLMNCCISSGKRKSKNNNKTK